MIKSSFKSYEKQKKKEKILFHYQRIHSIVVVVGVIVALEQDNQTQQASHNKA